MVASMGFSKGIKAWINVPVSMTIFEGDHTPLAEAIQSLAVSTSVNVSEKIRGKEKNQLVVEVDGFPIKNIDVNVLPATKVIPGGQSIGVKLNTKGVLVVGHHLIQTKDGGTSPGEIAGIKAGDMIVKMNEQEITEMTEVGKFVQTAGARGDTLVLEIKRDNKLMKKEITPLKDKNDESYRMGLYIRD